MGITFIGSPVEATIRGLGPVVARALSECGAAVAEGDAVASSGAAVPDWDEHAARTAGEKSPDKRRLRGAFPTFS